MIFSSIYSLVTQLNDYLKIYFKLSDDIAFISPSLKDTSNSFPSNRISVSIINIEKENLGGNIHSMHIASESSAMKSSVGWQINIYVLFSAIFLEKQYPQSIQVLSRTLSFLQKNNIYNIKGYTNPLSIEIVNLSIQELSNLWGICGGAYFPSVLCKIRGLYTDESEILDFANLIGQHSSDSKIKNE